MVVEFVGLSGAGKSTLLGALQARLQEQGRQVRRVSGRVSCGEELARGAQLRGVLTVVAGRPLASLRLATALTAAACSSRSRLGRVARVRLALKWLRRLPLYTATVSGMHAPDEVWLMDRGLVTNLVSVAMRSGPACLAPLLDAGIELGAGSDRVVLVLADIEAVRARRAGRGGEDKHWMDLEDWELEVMNETERLLRERADSGALQLSVTRADAPGYPAAALEELVAALTPACGAAA